MKHKVLQVLFNGKVNMELKKFKRRMLECEPEEIWNSSYEINTKIEIYELLIEMAPVMLDEQLQVLISFSEVLDYLYEMWMKESDSRLEELQNCIEKYLPGIMPLSERRKIGEIVL